MELALQTLHIYISLVECSSFIRDPYKPLKRCLARHTNQLSDKAARRVSGELNSGFPTVARLPRG